MKKLTAATLFCLLFLFAQADTFIVTSNADSGPGTLREAITRASANGAGTADFIHFAIADHSIAGRTISLLTPLPDLSSDLIIDGTTQPGSKIGVSDAKIRITSPSGTRMNYVFRIINQKNISFFGLHITKFLHTDGSGFMIRAIALMNAENITIGAAGKGNYFTHVSTAVGQADLPVPGKGIASGLTFKSNIVNLSEDGESIEGYGLLMALDNVRNLQIGGEQPEEGNFLSGYGEHILWTYTDTSAHINLGTYTIMNNKLGCNYAQTKALKCGSIYLRSGNSYWFSDTTKIIIHRNTFNSELVVGSNWMQNFIRIEDKKGFIDIKGNKVGLLSDRQQYFNTNILSAFIIGGCENGIIGGDHPLDSNFIAGCHGYAVALGNNKAIRITKNSMFCNSNGIKVSSAEVPVPKTKIFTITDYLTKGTTLPNSKVEVFLTKQCVGCDNGKLYLGHTMADDTGGWSFTSPVLLDGAVTATGTSPAGATGEFAKPEFEFDNYEYQYPTCNQNNGYINGVRFVAGTRWYWLRNRNGVVDTLFTEDVINAGPGLYQFVVEQGKYCSTLHAQTLEDRSPKINAQFKQLGQPSCGLDNGSITAHYLSGSYNKVLWKDASGAIVGTSQELLNVGAGRYKLVILDTLYGCGDSTGFYTLVNQSGPSLHTSSLQITPATCHNQNGSITGITATNVTGTPNLRWVDSVGTVVGNGFDLHNVPAGKYRLKFKDDGGCDTITTSFYTINNLGEISVDTSARMISPTKCSGPAGSIRNIKITGGESYEWKNTATGTVVGTSPDVTNLPAGSYRLTVTNRLGCSRTLPPFTVGQTAFDEVGPLAAEGIFPVCGKANGSVAVTRFSKDTGHYTFRWVDSVSNQTIGRYTKVDNLDVGTYLLFAKDSNGCEKQLFKLVLLRLPMLSFDYTNLRITPDQCLSGKGAIAGVTVKDMQGTGGTYTWLDSNNLPVGGTLNLQNIPPGTYRLQVTDGRGCTAISQSVTVDNRNVPLTAPQYDEQLILKGTAATLTVKNPQSGTYQLFDNPTASIPVGENTTGRFTTPVLMADQVFYVRYINGVCASELVPVPVKVIDKTAVYVPTAFTPNGDGKNDVLKVIAYGRIRLIHFTVYNRWGQVVFSTSNFAKGWNGTMQGHPAETGVYVWLVKAVDEMSGKGIEEKGTVTVIR